MFCLSELLYEKLNGDIDNSFDVDKVEVIIFGLVRLFLSLLNFDFVKVVMVFLFLMFDIKIIIFRKSLFFFILGNLCINIMYI